MRSCLAYDCADKRSTASGTIPSNPTAELAQVIFAQLLTHFVTLILVHLDPHTHSLLYSSAGHCPGYILDQQGRTKAILASTACPLGLRSGRAFPTGPATTLEPGELLFLFTDGVVESTSPQEEQFGLERTLAIVRAHQQEKPEDILDALFDGVRDFSGHQLRDDLTAVIIKAEGLT